MTDEVIAQYIQDSSLINIRREKIAHRSLQAFPIAFSQEILCVYYVCDFRLDGILFLRRSDISSIDSRATDRFQRSLMKDAGLLLKPEAGEEFRLESFTSVLESISKTEIVIVECESREEEENFFTIGRYAGFDTYDHVAMHEFSGAANWDDDLTKHALEDITCVQLRNNYIMFYQQYFDRTGFPQIPSNE